MTEAAIDLLAKAREFVDFVANTQRSGEAFVSYGDPWTTAEKLRRQADAIERDDARIARARALRKEIAEALK